MLHSLLFSLLLLIQTGTGGPTPPPPAGPPTPPGNQVPVDGNIWILMVVALALIAFTVYRRSRRIA